MHVLSCNMRLNLDYLVEKIWEHLNLIKVFTKKRGRKSRDSNQMNQTLSLYTHLTAYFVALLFFHRKT